MESEIKVFTTRPDTIYGATFVAISVDNPLMRQELLKDNEIDTLAYERYLD